MKRCKGRIDGDCCWLSSQSYFFRLAFPDLAELARVGAISRAEAVARAFERMCGWASDCLKKVSSRTLDPTAEDVVATTIVRIAERGILVKYKTVKGRADAYLRGTIRRIAQELSRKYRLKDRTNIDWGQLENGECSDVMLPEQDEERLAVLQGEFEILSHLDQDVLCRKFGELFGVKPLPVSTTPRDYARRHRALRRLRERLRARDVESP